MVDHRLEIAIYRLLTQLGISPGPWIADEIEAGPDQHGALPLLQPATESEIAFRAAPQPAAFLKLVAARFAEIASSGRHIGESTLEYVTPQNMSSETVTALPYMLHENEIWIGLELRHLPAAQILSGSARIVCVPAWRVAAGNALSGAQLLATCMRRDFDSSVCAAHPLGGSYYPSPGTTPERAHPFAVRVDSAGRDLRWSPLREMIMAIGSVADGHLLCSLFRFAHATGALTRPGVNT
jgi:hypothetical protein